MSKNTVYVDELNKYNGQPEGGGVVSPKNGTTIYFTVTSASDPMSVYNTDDKLVLNRVQNYTYKQISQTCCCYLIFLNFYSYQCLSICN